MHIGDDGLHVLKYYESCRLEAYPDPATGGEPITIGWGSTYPGLKLGDTITQKRADELLAERLADEFEPEIHAMLLRTPSQLQFDALVCWAYNVGVGAARQSTLIRLFNAGEPVEVVAAQFLRWDKAAGKSMWGLRRRRVAEKALFQGLNAATAVALGDKTL